MIGTTADGNGFISLNSVSSVLPCFGANCGNRVAPDFVLVDNGLNPSSETVLELVAGAPQTDASIRFIPM